MRCVIQTKGLVKKYLSKNYTKWNTTGHVGDFVAELFSRRVKREWKTAVDGVDITVEEGEFVGLFGPNGSGKTTLLKVLSSFTYPTKGEAFVKGYSVREEREKVLELVNYVPGLLTGGAWVNADLTARRNLQFVVEMFNLPKDKVDEALEVMGLAEAADKRVGTFSSGMAARLLLAFSLLRDAPVLLLDEPTVGVSPEATKDLLDHIAHLNQDGATVVYATHHIPEIQKLCTKVFIMDEGKVIAEGTPKQLIKSLERKEVIELSLQGYTTDVENHLKALPNVGTVVGTFEDNPYRSSTVRLHVDSSQETLPLLIQLLVKTYDCQIRNIQIIEPNLEDVYMHFAGRRIE